MVQPQNISLAVEEFLQHFKLDPATVFRLDQKDEDTPPPSSLRQPRSILHLATHYFDFQSIPRRSFFELLSHFASASELESEKLEEFNSAEGQEELHSYCNRPRRTILEVLSDFPTATAAVPFPYLFDLIPALQPRAFSIASSMEAHPGVIQILMAVVHYKTKLHKPRTGVCTSWLASLSPRQQNYTVPVWVAPGTISFPRRPEDHVIMIGPGTGCAPFRAYIEERVAAQCKGNMLFFGCRSEHADYFFRREWLPLVSDGWLQLCCAFSRDQQHKEYVQHKLLAAGQAVWEWLGGGDCHVFIAGNAKNMPQAVLDALRVVCVQVGGLSEEKAARLLTSMETSRKLQLETWA